MFTQLRSRRHSCRLPLTVHESRLQKKCLSTRDPEASQIRGHAYRIWPCAPSESPDHRPQQPLRRSALRDRIPPGAGTTSASCSSRSRIPGESDASQGVRGPTWQETTMLPLCGSRGDSVIHRYALNDMQAVAAKGWSMPAGPCWVLGGHRVLHVTSSGRPAAFLGMTSKSRH